MSFFAQATVMHKVLCPENPNFQPKLRALSIDYLQIKFLQKR